MMTAYQLIKYCRHQGILLTVNGQKLKIQAAKALLTPELTQQLQQLKAEILLLLQAEQQQLDPIQFDHNDFPYAQLPSSALNAITQQYLQLDDLYLATPMQQGMIFHAQHTKQQASYHTQVIIDLEGDIDVKKLAYSWQQLIDNLSILRTGFVGFNQAQLHQFVVKTAVLSLVEVQAQENLSFQQWCLFEKSQAFIWDQPPLMRLHLYWHNTSTASLVWTHHHSLLDGWSLPILLQLWRSYYQQQPPILPLPFRTFIEWRQQQPQEAGKTYWQERLAQIEQPCLLSPKSVLEEELHHITIPIKEEITQLLLELAKKEQVTLSTLLQCAWGIVSQWHTQQDNIVFGRTVSGRPPQLVGNQAMVGLFINTLPTIMVLNPKQTIAEVMQQLQQQTITDQRYDFVALTEMMVQPYFDSLVVVENFPITFDVHNIDLGSECSIQKIHINDDSHYAFTLTAIPKGNKLNLSLRTSYIALGTQIQAELISVLTQLAEQGSQQLLPSFLGQPIPALTPYAMQPLPHYETLWEWIAHSAMQHPHWLALRDQQQQLTYADYSERTLAFAAILQQQKINHQHCVALLLPNTVNAVVVISSILATGAAYMVLNPQSPISLQQQQLEQAGCHYIISDQVQTGYEQQILIYDQAEQPASTAWVAPEQYHPLAYILFTSGSQGLAKAVQITQENLLVSIQARLNYYTHLPKHFLLLSPLYFDSSVAGLYWTLTQGGCLTLANLEQTPEPQQLAQQINSEQMTHLLCLPSLYQTLLPHLTEGALTTVIVAGESCPYLLVTAHHQQIESVALYNEYGPTEGTVWASVSRLQPNQQQQVSIGYAAPHIQIARRDYWQRWLGFNSSIVGEMVLFGPGVSPGYLQTTEQGFALIGEHWAYMSGDYAYYHAAMGLVFSHRRDQQVKLRGIRVELTTIAAQCNQQPEIEQAELVIVEQQLIACILWANQYTPLEQQRIIATLNQQLPTIMQIQQWFTWPAFAYTANGKLNRRLLEQQVTERYATQTKEKTIVAPETPLQQQLLNLFEQVLPQKNISIDDHFYQLGGHSLRAMQLVNLAQAAHLPLSVSLLLEQGTIRSISRILTEGNTHTQLILNTQLQQFAIPTVKTAPTYALSYNQQRLWFLQQLTTDLSHYHIVMGLSIQGEFDREQAEQAFQSLLMRHQQLQMGFNTETPEQYLLTHVFTIAHYDLISYVGQEQQEALQHIAEQQAYTAFDWQYELPLRVSIVTLAEHHFHLLITLHHGFADGLSIQELCYEWAAYYQDLSLDLPPLPYRYLDYVAWQQQLLTGQYQQTLADHWQQQLAGAPVQHSLPTDFPRTAQPSVRGRTLITLLHHEQRQQIQQYCQQQHCTEFHFLFSVFSLVLARLSQQQDVVIGTPVSGRLAESWQKVVGFFANTIPLRSQFSSQKSWAETLKQQQQMIEQALAMQAMPFERMVDLLGTSRTLNHNPIFQILFTIEPNLLADLSIDDLDIKPVTLVEQKVKFDLELILRQFDTQGQEAHWQLHWQFNADLFYAQTIEQLSQCFHYLLTQVLAEPNKKWSDYTLVPIKERENNPPLFSTPLNQIIQQQAQITPNATAIVANHSWSYKALEHRSNQYAHYLSDQGVTLGSIVVIQLPRTAELWLAIIAVIKLGAAYVPVDPKYPEKRQQQIIDKVQPNYVITTLSIKDYQHYPVTPLSLTLTDELLAYIIPTSGSTGEPKAVMISQGNVRSLLGWSQSTFTPQQVEQTLASTAMNFDLSVFEMWATWLQGGCLQVVEHLYDLLTAPKTLSLINTVPSGAKALLAANYDFSGVKVLNLAGEYLEATLVNTLLERYPQLIINNLYAPSETTTYSTMATYKQPITETKTHIGYEIPGTIGYVVDQFGHLLPSGFIGEYWLAGAGVSRGYLDDEELTQTRFIHDPFVLPSTVHRLFKTGDLVRRLSSGAIDYIGRDDQQIKIRGFRIELGDLEQQVTQHSQVQQAVALYFSSNQQLFLVVVTTQTVTTSRLRQWLQQRLPEYALPQHIVIQDHLPLTANGKVDRQQLAQTLQQAHRQIQHIVAHELTPLEEQIAIIWQQVLPHPPSTIKASDNFFALGGDSILCIHVVTLARQQQLILTVKALFEYQNLAALAQYVVEQDQAIDVEANYQQPQPPLAFAESYWRYLSEKEVHFLQGVQLQVPSSFSTQFLQHWLTQLYQDFPMLSLIQQQQWYCRYYESDFITPSIVIFSEPGSLAEQCAQLRQHIELDQQLFVVGLVPKQHRLLFLAHHMLVDAASWHIILQHLLQHYRHGRYVVSPSLSAYDYKAYLLAQDWRNEISYWQQQIQPLTYVHTPSKLQSIEYYFDPRLQSAELTQEQLLFSLYLAIMQTLNISSWRLYLESHGRSPEVELSQSLGWFTTSYPLTLTYDSALPLIEQLQQWQQAFLAIPHLGLGFGVLKQWVASELIADDQQPPWAFNFLGHAQVDLGDGLLLDPTPLPELFTTAQSPLEAVAFNVVITPQGLKVFGHCQADIPLQKILSTWQQHLLSWQQQRLTWLVPEQLIAPNVSNEQLKQWQQNFSSLEQVYPLSNTQLGLQFHSHYEQHTTAYQVHLRLILEGKIDRQRFLQAWQQVLSTHEIFRSHFVDDHQLVLNTFDVNIATEFTPIHFKQNTAQPWLRLSLYLLEEDKYQFDWQYHHMLLDGWSSSHILASVLHAYQGTAYHNDATLWPHYWYWLQRQSQEQAEAFWREQLQGNNNTHLALATPNTDYQVSYFDHEHYFSQQETQALQQLIQQQHVTLSTLVQVIFGYVLQQRSQQDNILFATTVSGRTAALSGIERMVGLLIATIPIVINFDRKHSWLSTLKQQQELTADREHYAYLGLGKILQQAETMPTIDALLIVENYPLDAVLSASFDELRCTDFTVNDQTHYPLTLTVIPATENQGLGLRLTYRNDCYLKADIQSIFTACQQSLLQTLTNTGSWGDFSYPTLADHPKWLALNATEIAFSPPVSLLTYLEEQQPDAIALVAECRLTYAQLLKKIKNLAAGFQQQGVQQQHRVVIDLPRTSEQVLSVFALWCIAAIPVPIAEQQPFPRKQQLIIQSQADFVLTHHVASYDGLSIRLLSLQYVDPISVVTPVSAQDMAYILFTSGSTGQPKGVRVCWSNLFNFLYAMQQHLPARQQEVVLSITANTFDICFYEWLYPLLTGGTLVLATEVQRLDPTQLVEIIQREQVSWMQATPSHWQLLLSTPWLPKAHFIALVGGESCHYALAQQLLARISQVWHVYGPTEATIWSTIQRLVAEDAQVPLGKPLANTQLSIFDSNGQSVPVGVKGELMIHGAGVGLGYLDQDFTDPYATGDYVRFDGEQLLFIGREDTQLKRRGYRIDLSEIETALLSCMAVKQGVVYYHQQRIIAVIVGDESAAQQQLLSFLPEYMQPDQWLSYTEFPYTRHQKIDRQHIFSTIENDTNTVSVVAAKSPIEQRLLTLWQTFFPTMTFGIEHSFFALGGHSVLAMQLITKINQHLDISLHVVDLFTQHTIHLLADFITRQQQQTIKAIPVHDQNKITPSFAQQRLWFLDRLSQGSPHYNIVAAVKVFGRLRGEFLRHGLSQVIERHHILRTRFHLQDQALVGELIPAKQMIAAYHEHDLSHLNPQNQQAQIDEYVTLESNLPFDLTQDCLCHLVVMHLSDRQHILLLNMHHSVSDGESVHIVFHELMTLYQQLSHEQLEQLPPLAIQYADYAYWQKQQLNGAMKETLFAYWQQQLADLPAAINLPIDEIRPELQSFQGNSVEVSLSIEQQLQLQQLAQKTQTTQAQVLYAVYAWAIAQWSHSDDFTIGTPISLRQQQELQPLVGIFLNMLVLRNRVTAKSSFSQWLIAVHETWAQAINHQALPFEQLVDRLQPERDLSRSPLFQVAFVMQQHQALPHQAGLEIQYYPLQARVSRFDLTLSVVQQGQRLSLFFEYNNALFLGSSIQKFVSHWQQLFSDCLMNPEISLPASPFPQPLPQQKQTKTELIQVNDDPQVQHLAQGLLKIWQQILPDTEITLQANFFALGGDSLLATVMIAYAESADIKLTVEQLFAHPVLYELAQNIINPEHEQVAIHIEAQHYEQLLPVSYAQKRLWFVDQLEGSSQHYNMCGTYKLRGRCDVAGLKAALTAIIARHHSLRTGYKEQQGQLQSYLLPARLSWQEKDITQDTTSAKDGIIRKIVRTARSQQFDLTQDVLLKVICVHTEVDELVLILTLHHIAADGWSVMVLIRELEQFYQQWLAQTPLSLPPLAVQYADYAAWQQTFLTSTQIQQSLHYWQQQLQQLPTVHELPLDHHRPPQTEYDGRLVVHTLAKPLSRGLTRFAGQQEASLFVLLETVFSILVARLSNRQDVVLGSPVSGRVHPSLEALIGCFVNTLVLRSQIDLNVSFLDTLQQNKIMIQSALQHQQIPFDWLVERLNPERSVAYHPLVQLMFVMQGQAENSWQLPGIEVQEILDDEATIKFDLEVSVTEQDEQLVISWQYNRYLFDEDRIHILAENYEHLLQHILINPHLAVGHLPLLTLQEQDKYQRQAALATVEISDSFSTYFNRIVTQYHDKVAITDSQQTLTYSELQQQSWQLAHYFLSVGLLPGQRIALYGQPQVATIVAQLACLHLGISYVPLSLSSPEQRLLQMCELAEINYLFTSAMEPPRSLAAWPVIYYQSAPWQSCPKTPALSLSTLSFTIPIEQVAYIMFTSGSTGIPKAVLVSQQSIIRLVVNNTYIPLSNKTTSLLLAPTNFDASTFEIWSSLLNGGKLVIFHQQTVDLEEVRALVIAQQINTLWLTSALFDQWVLVCQGNEQLQWLLTGGDIVNPSSVQTLYQKDPLVQVINGYGPTENTTFSTCYLVSRQQHYVDHLPIGQPIRGSYGYVLDQGLQIVPVGGIGHLYVGGQGLALGYLHDPIRTAQSFIPDPFSLTPGQRLYITGDRVRVLVNGQWEFIGRIDNQIKIRGFRIDLGEIEHAIQQQSAVLAACVAVQEIGHSQQLIAYVQRQPEYQSTYAEQDLLKALMQLLPDYMLPWRVVLIEQLPITANGKIHRQLLPPIQIDSYNTASLPPTTELEKTLVQIWQSVLGLEKVGLNDNFFELGGDSILSIQVVSRCRELGIQLGVREIYQYQSIANLAQVIPDLIQQHIDQSTIQGVQIVMPIARFILPRLKKEETHFNQAVLLALDLPLTEQDLQALTQTLIQRHDVLRLQYKHHPQWQAYYLEADNTFFTQAIHFHSLMVYPIAERAEQLAKLSQQYQTSFMFDQHSPLFRLVWFSDLEQHEPKHRLLFICHHGLIDGVSWRILQQDLAQLIEQQREHKPLLLPLKTHSYQQVAKVLLQEAKSAAIQADKALWLEQIVPAEYWPTTEKAPLYDSKLSFKHQHKYELLHWQLSTEQTSALIQQAPQAYRCDVQTLLLTAIQIAYQQSQGQQDLTILLEGIGRDLSQFELDVSATIGWFTTLYPFKLTMNPTVNLSEVIKKIKLDLAKIPAQGLSFGLLAELNKDPDLMRLLQPEKRLLFNYLGQVSDQDFPFQVVDADIGEQRSNEQPAIELLTLTAMELQGQLTLSCRYTPTLIPTVDITRFMQYYQESINNIITNCLTIIQDREIISATHSQEQHENNDSQGATYEF